MNSDLKNGGVSSGIGLITATLYTILMNQVTLTIYIATLKVVISVVGIVLLTVTQYMNQGITIT